MTGKTALQSQHIRQLQMQKRPGQVQIQGQQKVTGNHVFSLVEVCYWFWILAFVLLVTALSAVPVSCYHFRQSVSQDLLE